MKHNRKLATVAALGLSAALLCTAVAGGVSAQAEEAKTFDDAHIVFSFGVMSDLHFDAINDYTQNYKNCSNYLATAVNFLKGDIGEDNLKAICTGGDSDNWNGLADLDMMKAALDGCLDPAKTEILPTPGNHDDWCTNNKEPMSDPLSAKKVFQDYNLFQKRLGSYVYKDTTRTSQADITKGYYHTVIGGYHFLSVVGVDSNHPSDSLEWMRTELDKIRQTADKGKPVFIQTHTPPRNTVFGTDASDGARWTSTNIGKVLKDYPEVVLLTGHTHATIDTPQVFWQQENGYAVINAGSLGDCQQFAKIEIDQNNVMRYTGYKLVADAESVTGYRVVALDRPQIVFAANEIPEVSSEISSEISSETSSKTPGTQSSTATSSVVSTTSTASVSNTDTGATGVAGTAGALALASLAACAAFCLRKKHN